LLVFCAWNPLVVPVPSPVLVRVTTTSPTLGNPEPSRPTEVQLYDPLIVVVPLVVQVGEGEGQVLVCAPAVPARIVNAQATRQAILIVSFPQL